jgi:hypothetical protein
MSRFRRDLDTRARLLDAARRWEEDARAEDERLGVLADYGCGPGDLMRRVASGFRELAGAL